MTKSDSDERRLPGIRRRDGAMVTVSVLLPVFNGEKYVTDSVESALAQTCRDFELIALDDGSTDGSLRILQELQKRDPRIRVISRQRRGLVPTLNEMMEQARGEYVAQYCQDDVALPRRLALQVAFLRENPKVVCVGGAAEMIDARGRYLTLLRYPETDNEIQRMNLSGHNSINASAATLRRASLVSVGGWDPSVYLAEDLDLWLRLGEIGQLANLRDPVVKYRLHSGSISAQNPGEQRAVGLRVCERAWQRRGIQGTYDATAPWRPGSDRDSRFKFMLMYGWWAFNSRERRTAIVYGLRAIREWPLKPDGWRLLACALVKPFGAQR